MTGKAPLEMHPADAAARGLGEGDRVSVRNAYGEVVTHLHLNGDLLPGVACLPKGLWARHTQNGRTANALRTVVKAAAVKSGRRVFVDIVDD